MNEKRAVVIGAGIIGCAIAFELQKKGCRVTCVDRNAAVGCGSTANSCAIVRTCYSTFQGVALAYEGVFYWRDWANYIADGQHSDLARYIECGMTQIKAPDEHWKKVLPIYDEIGIEYRLLSLEELRVKYPFFDTASFWPPALPHDETFWDEPSAQVPGAIFNPGEGYVNDPQLATRNLCAAAEAHGAVFLLGRAVTAVRHNSGRVLGVTLHGGEELDADIVVNVAGPHSFVINRMAGVEASMNVKTRALRHEVHYVSAPEGVDFEHAGCPTSDNDNGIYFRPEVGNLLLVGSGDPPCDPLEWIEDPDDFNANVTEARWKAQTYRLAKRFLGLRVPNETMGIADLYDVSDDWIPIYDRSDLPGFYMAIGTSGNQFKNAAPVAHMLAALIEACERGHDNDHDPVKVKGRYTGLELDLGFFSRLRAVNRESSFSVLG